jgi:antitoxin VapB
LKLSPATDTPPGTRWIDEALIFTTEVTRVRHRNLLSGSGSLRAQETLVVLRFHAALYILQVYIEIYAYGHTARVFRSGNSQAVRLPKQFRLNSEEAEMFRRGDEIVLREKDGTMVRAFDLLADLPDDFVLTAAEREKDRPQKRKAP